MPVMLGGLGHFTLGPAGITHLIIIGRGNQGDLLASLLVGRLDLVPRAAGREQVPTERTVADRALENQDRRIDGIAKVLSYARLYADLASGNSQPVIAPNSTPTVRATAALRVHVANVLAGSPFTHVIDHEGIEIFLLHCMFEGAVLVALDPTHFKRV